MSDSSDFSRRMHELLDEILSARKELAEAVEQTPDEDLAQLSPDAVDSFAMAADLMAQLVSGPVSNIGFGEFPETHGPERYRWIALGKLAEKLTYLIPVLGAPNWEGWVSNFVDEIFLLYMGDEPDLLKPAIRKTGQGKYPGRIAMLRLQAIQWQEFLKLKGFSPSMRDKLVVDAYGADAETIRKWRKLSEAKLGTANSQTRLDASRKHSWASPSFVATGDDGQPYLTAKGHEALRANGEEFQAWRRRNKG